MRADPSLFSLSPALHAFNLSFGYESECLSGNHERKTCVCMLWPSTGPEEASPLCFMCCCLSCRCSTVCACSRAKSTMGRRSAPAKPHIAGNAQQCASSARLRQITNSMGVTLQQPHIPKLIDARLIDSQQDTLWLHARTSISQKNKKNTKRNKKRKSRSGCCYLHEA